MKKATPLSISARTTLAVLLFLSALMILCSLPFAGSKAQGPTGDAGSGNVGPAPGGPSAAWDQVVPITTPGGNVNTEASCVEGVTCEHYTLTVNGTKPDWAGQRVKVNLNWASIGNEYDIFIHKGTLTGPLVTSAMAGPGLTGQTAFIDINANDTGVYVIHVVFDTTPVATDKYHGTATAVPLALPPPPNATVDTTNKIGYEIFEAPGVITPVTLTTGPTVEWLGRNAGEPSGGVNWNSTIDPVNGVTEMQSDLETLFVKWTGPANGGGSIAEWANRPGPTQVVIDSDPIGFTDFVTGRTFAAELSATSPTCKISFTDNDGITWAPTSGPFGSGIDHETIASGAYALPLPSPAPLPVAGALRAVYYCSQDLVAAFCLRSDDGGVTFGPPVQTYTVECGGLHGHVKVSPKDGSVYLPNRSCSGNEAAVVSENNGVTWSIRPVMNASVSPGASASDPAVSIDANGRIYFAMAPNDTSAVVAYSDDHGLTWNNIVNVSAALGLQNIRYPTATAGDTNRAAISFMGTTTSGDANASSFNGVWHLYVSHTFDGGLSWTTTDATPNLPVQRGNIWTGGGANIGRNLLDFFDITMDKKGRVQVEYVNGCSGPNCEQSSANATGNAYSATATIARQSSGKRMLSATDGVSSGATAPGMPFVTALRIGNKVSLSWSEADSGSSAITGYQILRSTTGGAETLLASVGSGINRFTDLSAADSSKTYYYKVIATNAVGPSAPNNEVAAPYIGDTCNGVLIHQNDPTHPEAAGGGAGQIPQLLIDYVKVGEPNVGSGNLLMFQMKVAGPLTTLPPTSRWRMVWDSFSSPGQQYYVGMTTNGAGLPTFEYGTIATAVVGLVLGVPQETIVGPADALSNYDAASGIITIYVSKSGVGNPQPGDLLGAVNGRTFGDNDTFERSTQLIDHTFVKAQTDNAYPTATYTVVGNAVCAVQPVNAVSRKTHGGAGIFDIPLPLVGSFGVEDRAGGSAGTGKYKTVVTFPVGFASVSSVGVTPGQGGSASVSSSSVNVGARQVTVNLTNVSNAQLLTVNLFGVTVGGNTGDVSVPVGMLLGDSTADKIVNSADVSQTKSRSGQPVSSSNFRSDVTVEGTLNSADVSQVKSKSGTAIP